MEAERKLANLGLELPVTPVPLANYVPAVRTGNLLFLAGHVPRMADGIDLHPGKLGVGVSIEEGYNAARQAALNCLSTIKATTGDLDKVVRVVKLLCMVSCAPEFVDQSGVANGASDLLVELYGDRGRHARSAVGMSSLPGNHCVEVEMVVEVAD